jgi:hypothetical protein
MLSWKMVFVVALILSLGNSFMTMGQSLSINDLGPVGVPSPPKNVSVSPGLNYVDVVWEAPEVQGASPISAYLIYIVKDYNWTGQYPDNVDPIVILGPDARSYRHTDLVFGNFYTYYLKAQNANGLSAYSDWKWARPGYTVPSAPAELWARIGDRQITLSWLPIGAGGTSVQGFHVYRGMNALNMTMIGTTDGWSSYDGETFGQTGFTETNLVNGVTYFYSVTTFNSMGESPRSNVVSIHPLPAPSNLTAFPPSVDNCEGVDIMVNWTFPAEDLSQIAAFRVISNHAPEVVVAKEINSYTFHVSGGWGYEFRVSALYVDGEESYSDPVHVGAPMCEGSGFMFDPILLLAALSIFIGISLVLVAMILLQKRKRKS